MKGAKQMNDFSNIPQEMRQHDNWVCWRLIEREGKKTKIPYNAKTGAGAKSNEPETWTSYQEALQALGTGKYDGIGFMFSRSPFVGVDIDHCLEGGELSPVAAELVQQIGSYTEISPSGSGLHIIAKGQRPAEESRDKHGFGLEMYSDLRYFTITGNIYNGLTDIREAQDAVSAVHKKYFEKQQQPAPNRSYIGSVNPPTMADSEIIERATKSKGGEDFAALNAGQWQALGYPSQSEADQAFCNKLAFWTGKDAAQMDALFRQSGLMRGKWDIKRGSQTYGEMTIGTAIRNCGKVYEGPKPPPVIVTKPAVELEKPKKQGEKQEQTEEKEQTEEEIQAEREAYLQTSTDNYLQGFIDGIKESKQAIFYPTGFPSVDALLDGGLYSGLYFIGAISSLGKTTFCLQVIDNIAAAGHDCLVFSLEMARTELIAKSVSRHSLLEDLRQNSSTAHAKSTRGITTGSRHDGYSQKERELIQQSIEAYNAYASHIFIHEGMGDIGVNTIREEVEKHIKFTGNHPIVLIDYLQILAPHNDRSTDKQNTDKAVLELKRLSRDYSIPIIGVSSFNRENYTTPVNMTSFKESGAVEYSSDVLIGLQYEGMDWAEDETDKNRLKRVRDLMKRAIEDGKNGKQQSIQVKVLKNRNGSKGETLISFWPLFNHFEDKSQSK